jgi:phosphate transport system ATP-binding protein
MLTQEKLMTNQENSATEKPVSQFASQIQRREMSQPDQSQQTNSLLVCKQFSVYYNEMRAINELSVAIPRGKVTAIIGPSGCGKSTFLHSINRMSDLIRGCHTKGEMLLDGEDVHGPAMDVVWLRRRVGMVFQKPNPFPKSIFANVAYGPRLHGLSSRNELEEVVERSLKQVALWDEVKDRLKSNALSLSGGQQQRLCIARTLAINPEVILFDEPTSALDPGSTSKIEDLMQQLQGTYTIIIVTHNMQQATRISDHTMFLYRGDLIEFSPTAELFTKPKHQQTERYITGHFG